VSPVFNLADLFELVVDAGPDRACLVAPPHRRTFGELDERATRLAHVLQGRGVGPGDHVAIHAANCVEWPESMLACFKIRAVPININYRYVESELREVYGDAECVAAILQPPFTVPSDLSRLRDVLVIGDEYEAAVASASPVRDFAPRSADDRYIVYTGGTTGKPKGVVWRHEDAFFATASGGRVGGPPIAAPEEIRANATTPQAVMMTTSPLMHSGAQWMLFVALLCGHVLVVWTNPGFDADAVVELAARERVNSLAVIGDAMARPLAQAMQKRDLPALFMVGSGGAPLTGAVKAELCTARPGVMISDAFGASEIGPACVTSAVAKDLGDAAAPARFSPPAHIAVLDDHLQPVVPGSGEIGRLARRGHIPLGYWRDEAKTAQTFPTDADGCRWVVPGDFATVDADGAVVLLGRGSQCINSGGEKIFPDEVEAALRASPDVYDAAVVGMPDERWGERCVALVQPRPGATIDIAHLREHCRTLIAHFKVPKNVYVVPEIQHTAVGKTDYLWAKDQAGALIVGVS
jgi:fatty-acyl-CoA synthase